MNRQYLFWISVLLGLGCLSGSSQVMSSPPTALASASTPTAADYFNQAMYLRGPEKIAALDRAIQLNPNDAEAHFERAEAGVKIYYEAPAEESRKVVRAIADYTQAIRLNPNYVAAYYRRGVLHAKQGDLPAALADYTQAIRLAPDHPIFYYVRGLLHDQLGNQPSATEDYYQVVRLTPAEATERADNQQAIAQFAQLKQQNSRLAHLYYRGLAHLYGVERELDGDFFRAIDFTVRNNCSPDLAQASDLNPKFADAYYYQAVCLSGLSWTQVGDSERTVAIGDLTKAIQLNPKFAAAYFERGLLHFKESENTESNRRFEENVSIDQINRQKAIHDLSQAIQLNSGYAAAYYYRGLAYSGMDDSKAITNYTQALQVDSRSHAYNQDALSSYLEALQTPPKEASDYYRRGMVRWHFNDDLGAMSDLNRAIRLNPKLANAYYYRGLISFNKDKKRQEFTQAIQLNPNFAAAYLEKGFTYSSGVGLDGGLEDFSAAIRIQPTFAQAFYARSGAYKTYFPPNEREKDWQQSLDDLTQAIRLNPDFAQTFCSARPWGDGGWACRSVDQVPERYTQIIRWNPRLAWGHYAVSELVRYEQEQAQHLVERSTQILQRDRQNADAYYRRGIAYLQLEKLDSAIADFTEAIRLNAQDAEAYNNRGFAHYRLKHYEAAIADYTQAIQLNPRFANAHLLRGLLHYDTGNHSQAIQDTTQAIRFDPTLLTAYIIRSRARFALGDWQDAKDDLALGIESLPKLNQGAGDSSIAGGGDPDVFYNRGVSRARRGDKQGAIKAFKQAASLYRSQGNMPRYRETVAFIQRLN